MNKVILMSIRPEWLVKILNGEKNIEIRKTMPKCELPLDVYLYCTKSKPYLMVGINDNKTYLDNGGKESVYSPNHNYIGNGKVVAKFTLKWRDKRSIAGLTHSLSDFNTFLKRAGIDWYKNSKEFHDYIGEKDYIYAWHIDNLVVFDKPMELGEFLHYKKYVSYSYGYHRKYIDYELRHLIKAPQSWQYVYVKGERK